ncbi:MAG: hypothetical protein H6738_09395 [Alphaproteobacteria bacterium]|nr:hypothetical protein [Alphaproteobacteria bacterium]
MLLFMMSTAFSSTLLTEDFGSLTSSGCSSTWSGDCEIGWSAVGPAATASSCAESGDDLVWLTPDSTTVSSGLSRTLTLAPDDDTLVWSVDVDVLDEGELTLAVEFRDANGSLLHTEESVAMMAQGSHVVAVNGTRPSNATTASVQLRFRGPGLGLAVLQVRVQGVPRQERTCAEQADRVEDIHRVLCEWRSNEIVAFFYDGECFGIERPSGCQVLCAEQCNHLSVIPPAPSVCQ